jgi:putative membrane protein
MIRAVRLAFLAALALLLMTLALANRAPVVLRLLPADMAEFLGLNWTIELPLFLVIFAGILLGLLVGFVWEWLREARIRSMAGETARKLARLERDLEQATHGKPAVQTDDVLALLEHRGQAR